MKMKLRLLKVLCITISALFCLDCTIQAYAAGGKARKQKTPLAGICLDMSNRYYSTGQLRKYINLASKQKNGYIQMHLTGDNNIGIECRTLGQSACKDYRSKNGRYINPETDKPFLSYDQIRSVLKYAKKKHVQMVPEIDMPGHMKGFARLYSKKYGHRAAVRLFGQNLDALQINSGKADGFVRKIYKEYAGLFAGCRYFHIGCDEFWDAEPSENISYINTTAAYLKKKGFKVWVWNDLIAKSQLRRLDHNITVTYWSWDGDAQSESVRKERRRTRASFTDLQKAGIKLLNYNSYYLYYVPSSSDTGADDRYMISDLGENWNIRKWDGENGLPSFGRKNISGSAVSVWNEDSEGVSAAKIYRNTRGLYKKMSSIINREWM